MNNSIVLLAALGLGAYFLATRKSAAPSRALPPDVTSLGNEVGKNVLDSWKSEQGKKVPYSYDPVTGQRVADCASKLRTWNPVLQRWECVPVNPGKDEEAEMKF